LSKIGVVLTAFNLILFIPIPLPFFVVVIGSFHYAFQQALIVPSAFLLTIPTGLILYMIGRKEFSDYMKDRQIFGLVSFLGFILIGGSLVSFLFYIMATEMTGSSGVRPPVTLRDVAVRLLAFIWFGLGFISGLLLLIDGGKMGEAKAPLKKEIDFEEDWKKYPEDLFANYVKQYPHNPTGVLRWHIDKKMKEGKTREQAIEELTKELNN